MRLSEPRVPPLPESEWDAHTREVLQPFAGEGRLPNIFGTLANHPDLLKRWRVFANHVLGKSTLPPRERELAILRIGWLCRAGYEWGQHVLIARREGLSDDEIQRVKDGPDAPGWSRSDASLLRAVDELHADAHVSDATWAELARDWDTRQLIDIVFTVGQYNLVSMALNSLGVQPDPGLPALED